MKTHKNKLQEEFKQKVETREALEKAKATEEKSVTNNNENTGAEKSLADRFGSALKVKISQ